MIDTYRDLLARCQTAHGVNRELDGAIAEAFGWALHPRFGYWQAPEGWEAVEPFEALPHFTGSMNTAVTLVGHVRPGNACYVEVGIVLPIPAPRGAWARIGKRDPVKAATPALAIVAALLMTLIP